MGTEGNDRPFVREHIIPSKRKLQKEFLKSLGRMFLCGAVFGIAAGIFLVMTENFLGEEKETAELVADSEKSNDTGTDEEVNAEKEETQKDSEKNNYGQDLIDKETDSETEPNESYGDFFEKKIKEWNQSIVSISMQSQWAGGQVVYESSAGFGIAIEKDDSRLYFLTRYAFLSSELGSLQVEFFDGAVCSAILMGKDEDADIAVISVENDQIPKSIQEKVKIFKMGDTGQMQTGSTILLLGRPNGFLYSADIGMISGTSQKEYIMDYCLDVYPTSVVRNENGSGVVVNTDGKLLGILTNFGESIFGKSTEVFCSISNLKKIITKIIEQKPIVYCGIRAEDIPQQRRVDMGITNGIYVMETEPNSPAAQAGIRTGDIIQKIEDIEITSVADFYAEISKYGKNEQIDVHAVRISGGNKQENKYIVRLREKE